MEVGGDYEGEDEVEEGGELNQGSMGGPLVFLLRIQIRAEQRLLMPVMGSTS